MKHAQKTPDPFLRDFESLEIFYIQTLPIKNIISMGWNTKTVDMKAKKKLLIRNNILQYILIIQVKSYLQQMP